MDGAGKSGAPDPAGHETRDDDPLLRAIARAPSVDGAARQGEPSALIGEVLDGKYRVDAVLGHGGMGAVYRATHVGTGREVALKVLLPELTAQDSLVERFRREAQAAGKLRHPNIVDVTDFGFATRGDERVAYLVMELVRGWTLRALLLDVRRPSLAFAIDVLDQVCAAMTEAHRIGVLHRDLKPENILLEPSPRGPRVKVVDFGIAKLTAGAAPRSPAPAALPPGQPGTVDPTAATIPAVDERGTGVSARATTLVDGSTELTRHGAVLGTPLYMSPEQWRGDEVDARTDVYSLGVVAYEIFAGEPPFLGKTRWIALEHAEDRPPPLAARGAPPAIASAIEAALAKKPGDRPPSVAAFAASLHLGSETTASLLRRSVVLTFNHFGVLCRCCAPLLLPWLVLWVTVLTTYVLARLGAVDAHAPAVVAVGVSSWVSGLGAVMTGLLVLPVADLLASRTIGHRPTLADVLRSALGALPTMLVWSSVYGAMFIAGGLGALVSASLQLDPQTGLLVTAFAGLGAAIGAFFFCAFSSLVGPVVAVERARGLAPLRRSFRLVRPVWRVAFGVQLFYGFLMLVLDRLVGRALQLAAAAPPVPTPHGSLTPYGFFAAWAEDTNIVEITLVHLPIAVLLTPFTLVAFALLYIRAREAEGKPLVAER